MSDFRSGHFEKAAQHLQQMSSTGQNPALETQTLLLLAMTQHRLGQAAAARDALTAALQIVEKKLPKVEDGLLDESWVEWVRVQLLLREARLLIED